MTEPPRVAVVRVGDPAALGNDPALAALLGRLCDLGRAPSVVVAVPSDMTLIARAVRRARQDGAERIVVLGASDDGKIRRGVAMAIDVLCDATPACLPIGATLLAAGAFEVPFDLRAWIVVLADGGDGWEKGLAR